MGNSLYKEKYKRLQAKYRASRAANSRMSRKIAQDNLIATREIVKDALATTNGASAKVKKQLKSGGCCLCGFNRHQAIDFHHVDKKTGNFSKMSPAQILKEIEECFVVVVCANCHRLIHSGAIDPDFSDKRLVI